MGMMICSPRTISSRKIERRGHVTCPHSQEITMLEVGRFSLYNNGGFVASIKFIYMGQEGMEHEVRATDSFPVLQTRVASPGECGVPDGSMVWLKVGVTAGYDNKSQRCFIYRAANQQVADFTISGTTLDNNLEFKGLRTPAPQELKPMMFGGLASKLMQKLAPKVVPNQLSKVQQTAKNIRESELFKLADTRIGQTAMASTIAGATYLGNRLIDDKRPASTLTTSSAFDNAVQMSDEEFAELVPQGLVGEIVGNLITSLAPVAGELTRVLLPLSSNQDSGMQITPQGLLDQLVQTIMPTVLPSIGKMAVLLTQSVVDEQAGAEVPPQPAAQPYVLPEDWRTAATHNG